MPSLISLQIREKKYDFHNYIVVQITILNENFIISVNY
jgi:hypothetical protein